MPVTQIRQSVADIARVAHEANRGYQIVTGERWPAPIWQAAPLEEQRKITREVQQVLNGVTPEQMHEAWLLDKRNDGWTYGTVKDAATKTDPCLVPYSELSETERAKDALFYAVVNALAVHHS